MSDLTIMIFVTLFLATCLGYFMYRHAEHLESLERIKLFYPAKRRLLLTVSLVAPFFLIIFIQASLGLI
jgi:hypothetical protein